MFDTLSMSPFEPVFGLDLLGVLEVSQASATTYQHQEPVERTTRQGSIPVVAFTNVEL